MLILVLVLDFNSLVGCGELSPEFSWLWTISGSGLQLVGFFLLYKALKIASINNEDLVPDDYFIVGFFRSKWFYVVVLIFAGYMIFSYGVSHPDSRGHFKLGTKITSCGGG